jgi:hypothetical protein
MFGSGSRLVPGYMMKGDAIAGRYRVDRVVGNGNSGFVVAARHAQTRERVALKVITNGPRPEVTTVARLSHPNLARIVDTGMTEELDPFVATEWLDGVPLTDVLAQQGKVPVRTAAGIIVQACAGLAVAHGAGLVHADLKPQNLFLTSDGMVKVLDFGMTLPLETEEGSAAWFASPAYLAPEQLREPTVDARADVWALGVILHQMLAGTLPFESETIAGMFVAVAYAEPKPLPDAPPDLATVVRACLAKDAGQRISSVLELAKRLQPFVGASDSVPVQLAMTIEAPVESTDAPAPAPQPKAAVERPLASRFWMPKMRLDQLAMSARLVVETLMPEPRTPHERVFARRRLGAVGVVAAAALLGVASLFASPGTPAAAAELEEEEVAIDGARGVEVGPFVPPSFALPAQEVETTSDRATAPPSSIRWVAPRARAVPTRANPNGFTHPSRLVDRPNERRARQTGGIAATRP